MKKKLMLCFVAALIIGCIFLGKFFQTHFKNKSPNLPSPYFVLVPIIEFTSTGIPCLNIKIGNEQFISKLDLGFSGYAGGEIEIIEKIQDKSFVSTKSIYDWKGNEYREKIYEIPKISIAEITFRRILLNEEAPEFRVHSKILEEGEVVTDRSQMRLGWKLFQKSNLFLDLGNSVVIFCENINSINNYERNPESFIKTPLILDNNLIELELFTSNGPLRCLLDSGTTLNMLRSENTQKETVKQMAFNPKNQITIAPIRVGEKNLGAIRFQKISLYLPNAIDAILGVEFLRTHQVFIDFREKQIYIAPFHSDH